MRCGDEGIQFEAVDEQSRGGEARGAAEEQLRITSWDLDLSAGQCGSASGTTSRCSRLGPELFSADCYLMNLNDDVCRFNIC